VLAAAAAIAILAAILITPRIPAFRNFLRVKLLDYLDQNYKGQFYLGRIDGPLLGEIAVRDLKVEYRGVTVLSASEARVSYRILPILRGRLQIVACIIEAPFADLRRAGPAQWNIAEAFSSRHPSAAGSALAVSVQGISIRKGGAAIELSQGKEVQLSEIDVSGDLTSRGSELRLDLTQVGSALSISGMPQLALSGRVSYDEASSGGILKIPELDVASRDSRAILADATADFGTHAIRGRVVLQKLASSDINSVAPQIGLAQDISGAVAVSGVTSSTVNVQSALSSEGSKIDLRLRFDLSGAHPAANAQAQLTNVRLDRLFRPNNGRAIPAGAISGDVTAEASRFALDSVKASLRIDDRGLSIQGWELGDAGLTLDFNRGAADLQARTRSQSGNAWLSAAIDTTAPVSYRINLKIDGLKPQKILRNGSGQSAERGRLVAGDINLTAAAKGRGYRPDTMNATASVAISRSRIADAVIQSGAMQARIAQGVLHVSGLTLNAQQSKLYAHGELAFAKRARGTMRYTADIADLRPWLSMANLPGDGAMSISGSATGNTERLQLRGAIKLTSAQFRSYSVQSGRLEYDLLGVARTKRLQGRMDLALHDVHAGIGLKSLQMWMKFEPGVAQHCELRADALQDGSRKSRLAANIAYRPGLVEAALSQISLATTMGTWRMIDSATIVRHDERLEMRRLRLVSGVQQLAIDGWVSLAGTEQLVASVERLDLARLSKLLAVKPGIEGSLSAELSVGGTARSPSLALSGAISKPRINQMQYQDVSLNGRYLSSRAAIEIAVHQDSQHWLSADAVLPVALGYENGLYHRISGDLTLRAKSPGIDLSFLDVLTEHALTGVRGTLSLDINAQGPIDNPHPRGYLALHDLNFTVAALNVPVRNLTAQLTFSPEDVRLVYLSAKARDGTLGGSGSVAIAEAAHPSNLQITFNDWPAISTAEYQAIAAGTIKCSGRSSALHVEGRTEILRGIFRPAFSLSESPSLRPDHTIQISDSWSAPPPAAKQPQPSWMNRFGLENLTLDLDARIHRDTWIENADAQVEIRGKLRVLKTPRHDPIITGEITTVQGTLAVAGKTFTVQQGQVLFTGGQEISPSLDIVAKYQAQNYQVLATVSGTAKKPELSLSSIPSLSQSDILSVLVFGKPSSQLTQGQQQGLQQQALSMAGGYAASQLGKAVAQALGLESLGINTAPGGGLGLGTYLTRNVYVSASQESSGTYGHRATMGYYLTPDLELETSTSTTQGNQVTLEWTREY
jgi:translocation-and-assembly-module (TAM) inner membrane subunit TamB-like protein